jgi:hypothetical protein
MVWVLLGFSGFKLPYSGHVDLLLRPTHAVLHDLLHPHLPHLHQNMRIRVEEKYNVNSWVL